jgi:uncharacterized protein
MESFPRVLVTAIGVQASCQIFKTVYYSLRERQLSLRYLVSAGGLPSAHAAFVTALAVAIGFQSGLASDVFAVAAVFGSIVIFDAYRLRGQVQRHARIINSRLLGPEGELRAPEMVGHSLPEVLAGILVGGGLSALASVVFPLTAQ